MKSDIDFINILKLVSTIFHYSEDLTKHKEVNLVSKDCGICSAVRFAAESVCLQQINVGEFELCKVPNKVSGLYVPPC
jgi:hypothetical protein